MAALMMLLTAVDERLDACFFGIQPDCIAPFRSEFGVPEEYSPIGGITIGHRSPATPPQSSAVEARRKGAADVVHRGQWGTHA
jgi:nitroreductase